MALSLLRLKRQIEGLTIAQLGAAIQCNSTDLGRIERLQSRPSRRVAQTLSERYNEPPERLFAEVK